MKTTKELILDASLKVFSNKGYVSGTTLEISKEAGVSEMTLFRHFKTKNNLFLTTIKQAIGESLSSDLKVNLEVAPKEFITNLLHEKFLLISKHILLVRMLIRESLSNTLPEELQFTKLIYSQVIQRVTLYVSHHKLNVDAILFTEVVVGLLLRYAIMEESPIYYKWDAIKQNKHTEKYIDMLKI